MQGQPTDRRGERRRTGLAFRTRVRGTRRLGLRLENPPGGLRLPLSLNRVAPATDSLGGADQATKPKLRTAERSGSST